MSPAARVAGISLSSIRRMTVGAPPEAINLGLGEPGWPVPDVAREALAGLGAVAAGSATAHAEGAGAPLSYGPNTSDPALVRAIAAHASRATTPGPSSPHPRPPSPRPAASSARSESLARTVREPRPHGPAAWAAHSESLVGPEQVMVTAGSQAALFALFQAHVDPGTSVLVPDPGFVAYPTLARLCGATPVGYPLGADGDLDAGALLRVLGERRHTSLVVLNHPANPTGGVASPEALRAVADACRERGVVLLSDEVYAELWVGERPTSVHDVVGVDEAVVLGSVSKAFAAPGLRVGWAIGAEDLLAPARLVHNAMTTAPARPSQAAALALLEAADEVLPAARAELGARWDLVAEVAPQLLTPRIRPRDSSLVHENAWSTSPQRAGIYLWLAVPDDLDMGRHDVGGHDEQRHDMGRHDVGGHEKDATEGFALRLRDEAGVTTIPGTAFGAGGAGFLRVGVGGPQGELEEGLRRLAPWWKA